MVAGIGHAAAGVARSAARALQGRGCIPGEDGPAGGVAPLGRRDGQEGVGAGRSRRVERPCILGSGRGGLAFWFRGPGGGWTARRGWQQEKSAGAGFGDVQPRYVYCIPLEDRSLDDVFAGFNQQWRRNIRKAEKSGVQVRLGTREDLAEFHRVYVETAERDHFTPRGLVYFERMWDALNSDSQGDDHYHEMTLHLAEYNAHLAAATIMIRVGDRAWYSYGASTTADRDVRPSNALQWDMITRAHESGCRVYDLRGISATLDPANHLIGLVRFKVGSGGYAQEYVGEWDYALRPMWARAFATYQKRSG